MNELTLAVAGGGKTQSIINACTALDGPEPGRTLAITYTRTGQRELSSRLRAAFVPARPPAVTGWFSFLLTHFVRPYLPRRFDAQRLMGLNFHGDPGRYAKDKARYLDSSGRAYRRHVAKLAMKVLEASGGARIERLERLYMDIYIDEAQDLVGWDLELLDVLLLELEHVDAYVRVYSPDCLRHSRSSAKDVDLNCHNFGEVKGLTFPRVLIYPTEAITRFLTADAPLEGRSACAFYVGVTRAQHSIAIVLRTAEPRQQD